MLQKKKRTKKTKIKKTNGKNEKNNKNYEKNKKLNEKNGKTEGSPSLLSAIAGVTVSTRRSEKWREMDGFGCEACKKAHVTGYCRRQMNRGQREGR